MADEEPKAVRGREFFDADEADERTLTLDGGNDGGGDAAKLLLLLEQKIEVLRREKAELVAVADAKAAEAKTIASHALDLEGEIIRIQEDLIHEESIRSNFETEFTELQRLYTNLEQEKALKVGELKGKISDLEKELLLIDSQRYQEILAATEEMQEKMAAKEKAAAAEMLALEQRTARDVEQRAARELEAVKALEDQIAGLKGEMAVYRSAEAAVKSNLEINGKGFVAAPAEMDKCLTTQLLTGAVAVTGTVAIAAAAFYLRQARQK